MLSPAKINLGLFVPFKRGDGYHQIASIFLRLDWGDEIEFESIEGSGVELVSNNHLTGKSFEEFEKVSERGDFSKNLLYKWFEKNTSIQRTGIRIRLTKRIPTGGGLGGGSSNAACLYRFFLPEACKELSPAFLQSVSQLGADIPFFLQDSHAEVHGIGEVLRPIAIAKGYGVLVLPAISLSTREMFLSLNKSLQEPPPSRVWEFLRGETISALQEGRWSSLVDVLWNDFEAPAFRMAPLLSQIKDAFYQSGAEYSSMSGSGSALYGIVSTSEASNSLWKKMQDRFPEAFVVRFSF